MARRYKIGKYYVVRDRNGRFKRWTRIGKSLKYDRRTTAKRRVKPGYGHRGDLKGGVFGWKKNVVGRERTDL